MEKLKVKNPVSDSWSAAAITVHDNSTFVPNAKFCFNCNQEFRVAEKVCLVLAEVERKDDPPRTDFIFQLVHVNCPVWA